MKISLSKLKSKTYLVVKHSTETPNGNQSQVDNKYTPVAWPIGVHKDLEILDPNEVTQKRVNGQHAEKHESVHQGHNPFTLIEVLNFFKSPNLPKVTHINEHIRNATLPSWVSEVENKSEDGVRQENQNISNAQVSFVVLLILVIPH